MQINVLIEHGKDLVEPLNIEGLASFVLTEMKCPQSTDVSISFVANGKNSTLGSPSSSMTLFSSTFSNDSDVTKEYVDHFRLRTWLDEHTDLINSSFDGVYKIQLYSKIW